MMVQREKNGISVNKILTNKISQLEMTPKIMWLGVESLACIHSIRPSGEAFSACATVLVSGFDPEVTGNQEPNLFL